MNDFEQFKEYGRLRSLVKSIDPYAAVFEKNNEIYIALSTGQVFKAEHFHERSDTAVFGWLKVLFTIGRDKRQKSLS